MFEPIGGQRRVWLVHQTWHCESWWRGAGRLVRVVVRHNPHDFQSSHRVDVWTPRGWAAILDRAGYPAAMPALSYVDGQSAAEATLACGEAELLEAARTVFGGGGPPAERATTEAPTRSRPLRANDDFWTAADRKAAQAEGWDVFSTFHDDDPCEVWEIERQDRPADGVARLDGDDAALATVVRKAADGSLLHCKALFLHHTPTATAADLVAGWTAATKATA